MRCTAKSIDYLPAPFKMTPLSMNSLPLISVITVCYNLIKNGRDAFFRQCAESVHQQNYPHIEHIVIDGGSQDGTVELLEEYAQKGWLKYISEPDNGIYDAMNKGLHAAKGKYVAFLNSDDFWNHPDGVAVSVAALESHGATFSYAPHHILTESGDLLRKANPGIGVFAETIPFCHQTMFARREVLLAHHGFDDKHYKVVADYELTMRLLLSGESCVYVPLNFTSFRLGGVSGADKVIAEEVYLVQKTHLGEDAAKMLSCGCMDDSLMQLIIGKVHGSVALDVLRCHQLEKPGLYTLAYGLMYTNRNGQRSAGFRCRKEIRYKLFALIPFLTIRQRTSRTDYFLFGVLPILRLRIKCDATQVRLFGFLPIFTVSSER